VSAAAWAHACREAGLEPGAPVSLPFTATVPGTGPNPLRVEISLRGDGESVKVLHLGVPGVSARLCRGAAVPAQVTSILREHFAAQLGGGAAAPAGRGW
jgi:hypothetical protein